MGILTEQRSSMRDAPAGLATALGYDEPPDRPIVGNYARGAGRGIEPLVAAYSPAERKGSSPWLWALPALALLGLLGYFLLRDGSQGARTTVAGIQMADRSAFVSRRLPGDVTLSVPMNGVESKLMAFIEDPNRRVDKDTWFTFDRLEFETGSAQLRPSSQEQLRNVAAILKAYPRVRVKIGGYTDNVGDDGANSRLSADRAANTTNELSRLGIDRGRMESEGYGEQFPIADNATDEGRQHNRRIDIRVTEK
jgi:outer membrane protein OmpA-like peptidoglycan-associated protein